jgi:hypothetical protein
MTPERKREQQRECMRRQRERMTPQELEAKRAAKRDFMRRWRAERPEEARAADRRYREAHRDDETYREKASYRRFCSYHDDREGHLKRSAAWKKANPERCREQNREATKRHAAKPESKLSAAKKSRRWHIRRVKDKEALARRITAAIEKAVPCTLPQDVRGDVVSAMAAAVYSGELPIRVTGAHAKPFITDHFRMFTKFGPESLDAPRFDDGSGSYHDTISEGLWQ